MRQTRLSRRTVLRGAGSIAIALPWLEIMGARKARAATAGRFLAVYTPGGTVMDKWRVTGTETSFALSPILKPLENVKDQLLVLEGLNMNSAQGEQHQAGIVAWLAGTPQSGANRHFAGGPSVDQVIATRISKGQKRKTSLQIAVRWATGRSHGLLHPINACNFEDNGKWSPIPPSLDPQAIWRDLFGSLTPTVDPTAVAQLGRRRSILDWVDRRYATLAMRLGAADRQKLEQHLEKIREIEKSLDTLEMDTGTQCKAPMLIDTADYNPTTGLRSDDDGRIRDASTDAAIPKVGRLMIDMMVMAFACDITAVGTLQWSDTEAKHTFPWLGLSEHHHYYQHDGGFRPAECEKIGTWYAQQHAYLLESMKKVDMGGHSLLDESVVFFGSELSNPSNHDKRNMPFLLAGGGGGLRGGRRLTFPGTSHNHLLVSILNLFGDTRRVFGDPRYCTGPLAGLT